MRDVSGVIAGNVTKGGISVGVGGCLGCADIGSITVSVIACSVTMGGFSVSNNWLGCADIVYCYDEGC